MLEIDIPGGEFWNNQTDEFVYTKPQHLRLEHSLISLTKWEEKYKKPFLTETPKTIQETLDYFRFMCIDKNVDPKIFDNLSTDIYQKIMDYIGESRTATTISNRRFDYPTRKGRRPRSNRKETLTSELIYYYMSAFNIPFECEKWNLSRLLVLIEVASIKTNEMNGGGKMNKGAAAKYNAELNKINRQLMGTKG